MNAPFLTFILIATTCMSGCRRSDSIPRIEPIVAIKVNVHEVPDLGIPKELTIQVPTAETANFAKLVLPTSRCTELIDPKRNYHVADAFLMHPSGEATQLFIRWTGANPAAVSLDDRTYYFGGDSKFPDGAMAIIRQLAEYERAERSKTEDSMQTNADGSSAQ